MDTFGSNSMNFLSNAWDDGKVLREVVSQYPGHAWVIPAAFFLFLISLCWKKEWCWMDRYNITKEYEHLKVLDLIIDCVRYLTFNLKCLMQYILNHVISSISVMFSPAGSIVWAEDNYLPFLSS